MIKTLTAKMNGNTVLGRVKRTFVSVLPVAKNRKGACVNCGACCKLPSVCPFLRNKLDGPVDYGRDLETNLKALYPLSLEIGRRISAKPVMASEYQSLDCPLYQNVHREGITI